MWTLETEVTWEGTFSQFKLLLLDHEWLCSLYYFIVVTSSVCSIHLLCLMETIYSMDRRNGKAFSSHSHIKLSETCIEKQFITCQNSPLWWPLMAHNIKSSLNVQLRLISGFFWRGRGLCYVYFHNKSFRWINHPCWNMCHCVFSAILTMLSMIL